MKIIEANLGILSDAEKEEVEFWDNYYRDASEGAGELISCSRWHEVADIEFSTLVDHLISTPSLSVLECGAGSGRSVEQLHPRVNKLTLLDFSMNALAFAHQSLKDTFAERLTLIHGNVFSLPFESCQFDLVRNCGVIEHYDRDEITHMAAEMLRVTKNGGYTFIGIPNIHAVPVIKAAILGTPFFRRYAPFLPGYRNESERLYSLSDLKSVLSVLRDIDWEKSLEVYYGSPLWSGAPEWLVNIFHRYMIFNRFSFVCGIFLKKLG